MPGPPEELDALVLARMDYREADRIVRLLTPELGHVDALARHARRSKRRFAGAFEPGNRLRIMLRRGRGELYSVVDAQLIDGRAHLRDDLERITLSAYLCDWVAALARKDQPEPQLFGLLDMALVVLDGCEGPPSVAFRLAFEAKALTFAGLTPRLTGCGVCGEPIGAEASRWDHPGGGVVHPDCGEGPLLEAGGASALERLRRTPLVEVIDEPPPPTPAWILYDHLRWQIGRSLRSRDVLVAVGGWDEGALAAASRDDGG